MDTFFIDMFQAPLEWFDQILDATNTKDIWLAGIFIMLSFTFLIFPLRGSAIRSAGSDKAKKSAGQKSSGKKSAKKE